MPSAVVERLSSEYEKLHKFDDSISRVLDNLWLLICGTLLMFPGRHRSCLFRGVSAVFRQPEKKTRYMHVGFALVETGTCRAVSASDTLVKNVLGLCASTVGWWSLGSGLARGRRLKQTMDGGTLNPKALKSSTLRCASFKKLPGELLGGFLGTSGFFGSDLVVPSPTGLAAVWSCRSGGCPTTLTVWFFDWASRSNIVAGYSNPKALNPKP